MVPPSVAADTGVKLDSRQQAQGSVKFYVTWPNSPWPPKLGLFIAEKLGMIH